MHYDMSCDELTMQQSVRRTLRAASERYAALLLASSGLRRSRPRVDYLYVSHSRCMQSAHMLHIHTYPHTHTLTLGRLPARFSFLDAPASFFLLERERSPQVLWGVSLL